MRITSNQIKCVLQLVLWKIIPAADRNSYGGTVKAGLSPSRTWDTVEDITAANIIIAVVRGGEFSAC